jgi:hypothetical protein
MFWPNSVRSRLRITSFALTTQTAPPCCSSEQEGFRLIFPIRRSENVMPPDLALKLRSNLRRKSNCCNKA